MPWPSFLSDLDRKIKRKKADSTGLENLFVFRHDPFFNLLAQSLCGKVKQFLGIDLPTKSGRLFFTGIERPRLVESTA